MIFNLWKKRQEADEMVVLYALRWEAPIYVFPTLFDMTRFNVGRLNRTVQRLLDKGEIRSVDNDDWILPRRMYVINDAGMLRIQTNFRETDNHE